MLSSSSSSLILRLPGLSSPVAGPYSLSGSGRKSVSGSSSLDSAYVAMIQRNIDCYNNDPALSTTLFLNTNTTTFFSRPRRRLSFFKAKSKNKNFSQDQHQDQNFIFCSRPKPVSYLSFFQDQDQYFFPTSRPKQQFSSTKYTTRCNKVFMQCMLFNASRWRP